MDFKSVFISTDLAENNLLSSFCEKNTIELVANSLIRFEEINNPQKSKAEVIFFSSLRSFQFFKDSLENKLLASYGKATFDKIIETNPEFKNQFKFIGQNTSNPKIIAEEFKIWLGKRNVLFPIGEKSNRSISSEIPENQKEEQLIYRTVSDSKIVSSSDIYVFTSPSNVESFLLENKIRKSAISIAWGKSTLKRMKDLGFENVRELEKSSLESLIDFLRSFA